MEDRRKVERHTSKVGFGMAAVDVSASALELDSSSARTKAAASKAVARTKRIVGLWNALPVVERRSGEKSCGGGGFKRAATCVLATVAAMRSLARQGP